MDKIKFNINKWAAWLWMQYKLIFLKLWWLVLTKWISMLAFAIIAKVRVWNEKYYDKNIVYLYQDVRRKQAFNFKMKVVGAKGKKHLQVLMIETAVGIINVEITKDKYPHLFKENGEKKD